MRGLRLYVRPIDTADYDAIAAFLRGESENAGSDSPETISPRPPSPPTWASPPALASPPAWGLLGKLLGDLVAVVLLEIVPDAVRVDCIVVRRDLRRKWIGRAMLREVEQLALKIDRRRIIVEDARNVQEFLRRTGFEVEGQVERQVEGERWVRDL